MKLRPNKFSLCTATYVVTQSNYNWNELKIGQKFCLDSEGKLVFVKASEEYAISLDTEEIWYPSHPESGNHFRVISFDTTRTRNSDSK